MVAAELNKYGFTNIDALDASQHMLEKAKEKKLYKQYICDVVVADKPLNIATGTYDALISCGTITGGYVKASAFDEVLRLVKQGKSQEIEFDIDRILTIVFWDKGLRRVCYIV